MRTHTIFRKTKTNLGRMMIRSVCMYMLSGLEFLPNFRNIALFTFSVDILYLACKIQRRSFCLLSNYREMSKILEHKNHLSIKNCSCL